MMPVQKTIRAGYPSCNSALHHSIYNPPPHLFVYVEQIVIIAALTMEHVCLHLYCQSLLFRFEHWSKQGLLILLLKLSNLKSCPSMGSDIVEKKLVTTVGW